MKHILLLLASLLGFTLVAAEPSKPATFELRLVVPGATPDTEQLVVVHQDRRPKGAIEERLNVQKKPLLDGTTLKSANVQKSALGKPEILLIFTEEGTEQFADVTRKHIGERLAIVIDGKVYSAPTIKSAILGGKAVIAGTFSEREATELAERLSMKVK
jgi:preprotein translocase subunit SecD